MHKQKKLQLLGAAFICSLGAMSQSAAAALAFDANVNPAGANGVLFGSGNLNGGFTVDQSNGVEVGLRGKLRHNAAGQPENTFNSNGDGTYSFDAGVAPTQSSPTAVWSIEWSINSDYTGNEGRNLDALTYVFGADSDPLLGTSWTTSDIINGGNPGVGGLVTWDHAIGTNAMTDADNLGGSLGTPAAYGALISGNNAAQNSWKAHWVLDGSFDPTVDGQYDFYLAAFDGSTELARTDISIIVGEGAAVVPIPAAAWLFGSAILGLGAIKRKKA